MMHYKIYLKNPQSHYIYIDLTISNINTPFIELHLPTWRPGRYELGNFAKNIKRVDAFDNEKKLLNYHKTNNHTWHINTNGCNEITVTYSYHTSEINAGNCFADENQLYINPVHLCLYEESRKQLPHVIDLDVPDSYTIVSTLSKDNKTLTAPNFDELADSPILASDSIQSDYYEVNGIKYWLHFNGECKPNFERIKTDFYKFTQTQLSFWGSIPVSEYHFIFQILPYKFYHGVEHQKSTVIAIGPGYNLNSGATYESVLGVSCHELFHTWNIKYIRPSEMLPYDFSKENHARTGFVYEGFTTYYGDLLLLSSGVFTNEQYFETLEERLDKHFHNYGRFNLSVAASSYDTWLDGYVPGTPYRKTSIYDEGNLIALMLDVLIFKHSNQTKGLKDVCQVLYNQFGKLNKGYQESDIISLCETMAGVSLGSFFDNYVFGTEDYETQLIECFNYLSIEFSKQSSPHSSEDLFGFKTIDFSLNRKITLIAPYSPAWKAGLSIGDEIIAVNGYTLKNDFNDWMNYYKHSDIEITVSSAQRLKTVKLVKNAKGATYFSNYKLKNTENRSVFNAWLALNS